MTTPDERPLKRRGSWRTRLDDLAIGRPHLPPPPGGYEERFREQFQNGDLEGAGKTVQAWLDTFFGGLRSR